MNYNLETLEFNRLLEVLTDYAETTAGRERASATRPVNDSAWVIAELERVEEVRGLRDRGVAFTAGSERDIRPLLRRAAVKGAALQPDELLAILHHLNLYRATRLLLDRERTKAPRLCDLAVNLKEIRILEEQIDRVLTAEGAVRDDASPALNRIRRGILNLNETIRKRLESLTLRLAKSGLQRGESFTIRDGRFVLPVRAEDIKKVKGIIHDRSSTGGTVFIEPAAIIDLGNELRTLELEERDEVRRILAELTGEVRRWLVQIEANEEVMTALDLLWAKAKLAELLDAYPPRIDAGGAIRLINARHPLLVLDGRREVVPLNLELGTEYTSLVISGPNAGGKSVALKCVGMLCLMTLCGMAVPALPGTEIPLFSGIFADIGDQQSLADDLSTFSAHAKRLKGILDAADRTTLVLIDEIGAGTDPQEGASLSIAALEHLTSRGVPTIVTTHHGALKAFAHSTPGCANGSMAFDLATLQPTYRFIPFLPGSSYALEIARRAGLSDELVNRARELYGRDQSRLEELIADLSEKLRSYEGLVEGERRRLEELRRLEEALQVKSAHLNKREKEIRSDIKRQLDALLAGARRDIERLVKELRESAASREAIRAAHEGLKRIGREYLSQAPTVDLDEVPQPPSREPPPEPVAGKLPAVGDWVMLDDRVTRAKVTAVAQGGARVCVTVGAVQLWIDAARVTVVKPPEPDVPPPLWVNLPDVPLELDVRGLDAMEAVSRTDKYIADAVVAGRSQVGIIHGKGHGILMRHIRDFLKKSRFVESYRFGDYGEGDYGVTIVTLKS